MELDGLRLLIEKQTDKRRLDHVLGCEQEAKELAARFGADVQKARFAALLHDITKGLDRQRQLQLCKKYDILPDIVEHNEAKLLHALTGAALAKSEYGAPEDVCSAIRWHTTGKADMTLLEKIIYLADYIEPSRDFTGIAELRKAALQDLDSAVLQGLSMSIAELVGSGRLIHPNTVAARNWLIMKGSFDK